MMLAVWMTAIIVGIIAFGIGKLSVYVRQDKDRLESTGDDPAASLDPHQYERLAKAQEQEIAAERELAKLIATLSFAAIAGVAALGQLKLVGTTGVIILSLAFFAPVVLAIANLQFRQSLLNDNARRLQEALTAGKSLRPLLRTGFWHFMTAALPKAAAITFALAMLLVTLALPATRATCPPPQAGYNMDRLYCSDFVQALTHND